MGRCARFFGAVGLLAVLSGAPAWAQLTSAQYTCQDTVAKQGRILFSKVFKELAKCQDKISKDDLPADTDCMMEAVAQPKIASAESAFDTKVQGKCDATTVDSLDFGNACLGVTSAPALVACAIQEHEQAAQAMIDLVYPRNVCVGGNNAGKVCSVNADCPPNPPEGTGVCSAVNVPPLNTDQQKCQKLLGKTVEKQAKKRLKTLQKCKRLVAKGKQGIETDCVATEQTKLSDLMAKSLAKIQSSCVDSVTATLAFSGACRPQTSTDNVAACALCVDDREADDLLLMQYGSSAYGKSASVKQIADANADCVKGPLSRCRADDYLMKNDKIRVVVQSIQRNLFGIGQFGGQIIDGDIVRAPLDPDRDNFEEWSTSLNIENTAHYTALTIINDGSNGGAAILRATGVDDLLDFLNPSAVVAGFGFPFPSALDDKDLPVTITTDYILEPGKNYVRVETTVHNTDPGPLNIIFGEFMSGSGQVETFQGGYAFGEPLVTSKCSSASPAPCDFVAYSGYDEADGVSYGYINEIPDTTTFTRDGVSVPLLGLDVVATLVGISKPNFPLAPVGDPDGKDSMTFTRYFVVGNGSVGAITDTRNEIKCLPTGQLTGTVTAGGSPAAGVDVTVLATTGNPTLLTYNAVTHARTNGAGQYAFTLPPANYKVVANLDGSPFEGGGLMPTEHPVTITTSGITTQNIALPATGALQVVVTDQDDQAIAAKASVVGFDPSPPTLNKQAVLGGLINNTTGVFGDLEDNLPFGVAQSIFIGKTGDSGQWPLEPGNYRVVVSHGPEYSISETDITVSASPAPAEMVNAKVEHVLDTSGFISGDFHVHSIQSADSAVKQTDRVLTMLAEGVDFFTPSEHDIRFDYGPTLAAMGVTNLISVAQSAEMTTFDYGHFNAWPMTVDPNQVNGGNVDHGGDAPGGDGQDFPSFGSYSLSPAEIIAAAHADPGTSNTVQINHIHSHFSIEDGVGLAIDTGVSPPQSGIPALARRLDPALSNLFSDTFDALEIWIGADRGQIYNNFLGTQGGSAEGGNIGDWFNLINQGIVRTGVADSDTHRQHLNQSGVPRSMVASPDDDPGDLGPIAETLSANVNDGRVVGTNGPMVRVEVQAASTGQVASLEGDDPLVIATTNGEVVIEVDIQSPTWAPFDRVEYYVNTRTQQRTVPNVQTGSQPPSTITLKRYQVCPDYVQTAGVDFAVSTVPVAGTSSSRLEASTSLTLSGLSQDIWVVVLVKGTDGVSKPMFPVIPNSLKQITNTTLANLIDGNLGEDGITALAFTNPLFVDADGGGWTAPGLQIGPCPP